MKQIKILVAVLLFTGGVISCGSESTDKTSESASADIETAAVDKTESTDKKVEEVKVEEMENEVLDPPPTEEIISRYNYDIDFDLIKKAILDKEVESLKEFCTGNEVKADDVITIFSDTEFNKLLTDATYESLSTLENEQGEIELVFSGLSSFTDEEGNVYESGVYLYFKQGDLNLELVRMLAAG
jgi:hypothetical protein